MLPDSAPIADTRKGMGHGTGNQQTQPLQARRHRGHRSGGSRRAGRMRHDGIGACRTDGRHHRRRAQSVGAAFVLRQAGTHQGCRRDQGLRHRRHRRRRPGRPLRARRGRSRRQSRAYPEGSDGIGLRQFRIGHRLREQRSGRRGRARERPHEGLAASSQPQASRDVGPHVGRSGQMGRRSCGGRRRAGHRPGQRAA